jgi:hypothetical protein
MAKRFGIRNDDARARELDPTLLAPLLQMLIDDLPRDTEEVRELGLRSRQLHPAFAGPTVQRGEHQQACSQTCWPNQKYRFLNEIAGPA